MASREAQALIRGARAGHANAQLALGLRYLNGGAGLPSSVPAALYWLERAAQQGCLESRAHIEQAQRHASWRAARSAAPAAGTAFPSPQRSRVELNRLLERAAQAGNRSAQLALGLKCAGLDSDGERLPLPDLAINYKRAVRWLYQAGQQGAAEAWLALARIHARPDFVQRERAGVQSCLARAAELGHVVAQLELGLRCWRTRRSNPGADLQAVRWLMRAAEQGSAKAANALRRISPPAQADWCAHLRLAPPTVHRMVDEQVLLEARLELACLFKLSRAEALLLDVRAADHGDCLAVAIRTGYGSSRRRIVPVVEETQRTTLDRANRLFAGAAHIDEGNYRRRLYRLRRWLESHAGM
jgi:TPR repeat protein